METRQKGRRPPAAQGNANPMKPGMAHPVRAFTLIECVVYVAVFFMVLGLAFMTYYRAEGNNRRLRQNADDILRAVRAGEQWRADVRRATGAIHWVGAEPSRELVIPQTNGIVKYSFTQETVWRQTGPKPTPLIVGVAGSRMETEPRTFVTGWRWEVELKTRQKAVRVKPLFTFEAAAKLPANPGPNQR